jgi:hypothetical protein
MTEMELFLGAATLSITTVSITIKNATLSKMALGTVQLSAIMLSVEYKLTLSTVVFLIVVMLSVLAPVSIHWCNAHWCQGEDSHQWMSGAYLLKAFAHWNKIYSSSAKLVGPEFLKSLSLLNDFQNYIGSRLARSSHCSILIQTPRLAKLARKIIWALYQYCSES